MKITVKDLQGKDQDRSKSASLGVKSSLPIGGSELRLSRGYHSDCAARRSGTACTKTMGMSPVPARSPETERNRPRSCRFVRFTSMGGWRCRVWSQASRLFQGNRKVSRLALQKVLSNRVAKGDVVAVEELKMQSPKTGCSFRCLKT